MRRISVPFAFRRHDPDQAEGGGGNEPANEPADEDGGGNSEAAKYRKQLRAAESERDDLKGIVDTMRRGEIARVAGERLNRGEDLLELDGSELEAFVDDDGNVSASAVNSAVDALVAERPYLQQRHERLPGQGGGTGSGGSEKPTMADLLGRT